MALETQHLGFSELVHGLKFGEENEFEWPTHSLKILNESGVFRWFQDPEWGGWGFPVSRILLGYLAISQVSLMTAFILTQRAAAVHRIERSENKILKHLLLPKLVSGETFATVGISHLTTSRQHFAKSVLRAIPERDGFRLEGYSPWVTGSQRAAHFVVGATLDDQRQILVAVPADSSGVTISPPFQLMALTGSGTGPVNFDRVFVPPERLLAGPVANVMNHGNGGRTGGLQTSALALGLSRAALDFLVEEVPHHPEYKDSIEQLQLDWQRLVKGMLDLACESNSNSLLGSDSLRRDANDLVLRATQVALVAAKGTGYVADHRVGRWCREALFFLVWSCPQKVLSANVCQWAGID